MDHVDDDQKKPSKLQSCRSLREAVSEALTVIEEKKLSHYLSVLKIEEYIRDYMVKCLPHREDKMQELMMELWDKMFM